MRGRDHLKDPVVDGSIIKNGSSRSGMGVWEYNKKLIFKKWDGGMD
jgi:hypothetical protein